MIKIILNDIGKEYDRLYKIYDNVKYSKTVTDHSGNTYKLPEGFRILSRPSDIVLTHATVKRMVQSVSEDFEFFFMEVTEWKVENESLYFSGFIPSITSTLDQNEGLFLSI